MFFGLGWPDALIKRQFALSPSVQEGVGFHESCYTVRFGHDKSVQCDRYSDVMMAKVLPHLVPSV
jgi:hypothetical protein